jgi:hypothetical protein
MLEIKNWNGRFRGNSFHAAIQEMVKHDIAYAQDMYGRKQIDDIGKHGLYASRTKQEEWARLGRNMLGSLGELLRISRYFSFSNRIALGCKAETPTSLMQYVHERQ